MMISEAECDKREETKAGIMEKKFFRTDVFISVRIPGRDVFSQRNF